MSVNPPTCNTRQKPDPVPNPFLGPEPVPNPCRTPEPVPSALVRDGRAPTYAHRPPNPCRAHQGRVSTVTMAS